MVKVPFTVFSLPLVLSNS
ncbi:hypothetical protein Goshw_004957 [Gossypium schwendimanii]|uniref:Uncharacterized protein n=1 Tax=Gossypium schwendimanii TaxID=34291 RepID=A0A7J9KQ93_GOSSC|nr:hypothetical protein [Gossypium schwendimanii]